MDHNEHKSFKKNLTSILVVFFIQFINKKNNNLRYKYSKYFIPCILFSNKNVQIFEFVFKNIWILCCFPGNVFYITIILCNTWFHNTSLCETPNQNYPFSAHRSQFVIVIPLRTRAVFIRNTMEKNHMHRIPTTKPFNDIRHSQPEPP